MFDGESLPPACRDAAGESADRDASSQWVLLACVQQALEQGGARVPGALQRGTRGEAGVPSRADSLHRAQSGQD